MDMKFGKGITRRVLSLLLVMCLGMLPGTAFATGMDNVGPSSGTAIWSEERKALTMGVADPAAAFLDGVDALSDGVDAGKYKDDQYGLKQAVAGLKAEYEALSDADKQDADVMTRHTRLLEIEAGIYLDADIESFIIAGNEFVASHEALHRDEFSDAVGKLIDDGYAIFGKYYATYGAYESNRDGAVLNMEEFFRMMDRLLALNYLVYVEDDMSDAFEMTGGGWFGGGPSGDLGNLIHLLDTAYNCRYTNQMKRNIQDAISLVQTAESALTEVDSILSRLRELMLKYGNSTNASTDREAILADCRQLRDELVRIAQTTSFNGHPLCIC